MEPIITALEEKKPVNSWAFPSVKDGFIAGGLSGLTVLLTYLLTMAFPDTMPGPTWIVSLIAYTPLVLGCLLYRHCLFQMYVVTFVGFSLSWALIALGMKLSFGLGLITGLICGSLAAGSLHLWSIALPKDEHVDVQWMSRFTCMMGIVYYVIAVKFGNMASIALEFFRAPFLLQPISIFGFATLEMLVLFTNCALAWWIWGIVKTRKVVPLSPTRWFLNPLVFLLFFWVLWIFMAGVITAAHKPIGKVKVATVGVPDPFLSQSYKAELIAKSIKMQIDKTGARFVVATETALVGQSLSCEELIQNHMNPILAGSGAYYVVGCARAPSSSSKQCSLDNMAYIVSPKGEIVGVYGKEYPTPVEESCTKTGPIVVNSGAVEGMVKQGKSLVADTIDNIRISTVICYDADFTGPMAKAADLGAQLFLNPSNDWAEVRHHWGTSVIRAVENRVAVVKAEGFYDPVIVDPFGKVLAGGTYKGVELSAEVSLSTPLKQSWMRQNSPYWICIAVFVGFTGLDIYTILKRRREANN